MTKNKLMKESSISVKVEDFIFDWSFQVRHFKLKINDNDISSKYLAMTNIKHL